MQGEVVKYSDYHGYGFIKGEDGRDYFVHVSKIISDDLRTLELGQIVHFSPVNTRRGWQAHEVRVIEGIDSNEQAATPIVLKYNPFTPQSPVTDPKKFAGRKQAFRNAVDALYNGKNILVTGPRGIGKSSIAYQLRVLRSSDPTDLLQSGLTF